MAFTHGKNAVFKMHDGTSLRDLSAYLQKADMDRSADIAEVTALGNNSKAFIAGLLDGKLSIEGSYDSVAAGYLQNMLNVSRAFEYSPAGTTATFPKLSGNAIMTGLKYGAPVDGAVTFSCEIQITGDVTIGTN